MVDGVLTSQSSGAADVGRVERSAARGTVEAVRAANAATSRPFGAAIPTAIPAAAAQQASSNSLRPASERPAGRANNSAASGAGSASDVASASGLASAAIFDDTNTISLETAPVGGGLLSTGVQVLLAETRSFEAASPFVANSSIDRALTVYSAVQERVVGTIRANAGRPPSAAAQALSAPVTVLPQGGASQQGAAVSSGVSDPGASGSGASGQGTDLAPRLAVG